MKCLRNGTSRSGLERKTQSLVKGGGADHQCPHRRQPPVAGFLSFEPAVHWSKRENRLLNRAAVPAPPARNGGHKLRGHWKQSFSDNVMR